MAVESVLDAFGASANCQNCLSSSTSPKPRLDSEQLNERRKPAHIDNGPSTKPDSAGPELTYPRPSRRGQAKSRKAVEGLVATIGRIISTLFRPRHQSRLDGASPRPQPVARPMTSRNRCARDTRACSPTTASPLCQRRNVSAWQDASSNNPPQPHNVLNGQHGSPRNNNNHIRRIIINNIINKNNDKISVAPSRAGPRLNDRSAKVAVEQRRSGAILTSCMFLFLLASPWLATKNFVLASGNSVEDNGAVPMPLPMGLTPHGRPGGLIGFRCDNVRGVTSTGVTIVEASTPITLTLFGDSFTTDTIVAFTAEYKHRPAGSANYTRQPGVWLGSRRHDCTDYNRVTSYTLTDADIISPNVASLTVTLPELDPNSAMYYYICLKQSGGAGPNGSGNGGDPSAATNDSLSSVMSQLSWVHQGDDWWVTIKVEPPILSITNDIMLIVFLLFLSAVTSGLNLGLMSLDMNELAVISSCGDQRERSYARTIAPLRKRGNYLLCSLLLGNVMVNSTLTIILEELTSGLVAIIGSTLAIVILGEIVPQAFCARQGLAIGAKTIYLTYAFMILTFPLSYPISCLLDFVLGEEKGNVYDRERLMEFIKITGHHTQLDADEVAIISGALKLKKIKVDQIMTRIEDVFMLPIDCVLDRFTIKQIIEKGYSRIPVYEFGDRKQIVALILAKDLALLDPDDRTPVANMLMYCKHPLIFVEDYVTLDVALNEFKTGKSHMAVVRQIYDDGETDRYYEAIGVVTLEDVIEEVLQTEINDETDTLSDNRRKRRRTDAQVAHLLDELTSRSGSVTPLVSACPGGAPAGAVGGGPTTGSMHSFVHNHSICTSAGLVPGPTSQATKQPTVDLASQLTPAAPTNQPLVLMAPQSASHPTSSTPGMAAGLNQALGPQVSPSTSSAARSQATPGSGQDATQSSYKSIECSSTSVSLLTHQQRHLARLELHLRPGVAGALSGASTVPNTPANDPESGQEQRPGVFGRAAQYLGYLMRL